MRVSSTEKLQDYQTVGPTLRIHWNHEKVTDKDGNTYWVCQEAAVPVTASRRQIIEAVMATKYPTHGAEFAALQDDSTGHAEMRRLAKRLADGRKSGVVPEEVVPNKVEALQAMLAIEQYGMAEAFQTWVNSSERTFAEKAFVNRTRNWRRDDPTLLAGASALGLTDEQLDDLFKLAATL